MKKQFKNLLALLFAAVLFLVGCNTDVVDETDVSETEVQNVNEFCLYENGTGLYTIVQSSKSSDTANDAGSLCWKTFKETFNAELPISDDWVMDPSAIPTDSAEILIGNTNRAESAEVYAAMDQYVYRITCTNNRIVIAASADTLLDDALEVFFANIKTDENGRVTVPSDLDITLTREQVWKDTLVGVPLYDGGAYTGTALKETWGFAEDDPSVMIGISETNADEFAAYIAKVRNEGFNTVLRADWGGVVAYQCDKDDVSFYTYHTESTGETRVIKDNSKTASLEEFNYIFETAEGETNELYLYGLRYQDPEIPESAVYNNNGMLMFIKLADNSLIAIDGGMDTQIDSEEFMEFAREITGIPEGEQIRIACWFITHKHGDHIWGFDKVLKECANELVLERMMYNHKNGTDFVYDAENPNEKYHLAHDNVMYHLPRTGETIQFGDVTLDVLYTQEDLVNIKESLYRTDDNYNNSGTVLRITMDGKTCMIFGDIDVAASNIMMKYYTEEQLKCDMMQVSHHGYNYLAEIYKIMDPTIALFPVARNEVKRQYPLVLECVESICEENYFGGTETIGLRAVDGEMQVIYRRPVTFPPITEVLPEETTEEEAGEAEE
ncbi:MAG: hypothetical protein IJ325_13115 [Clostridia bacterium]|nr:hypothetical protein [Clostridia bacterium]